jgi:hypothetical protein
MFSVYATYGAGNAVRLWNAGESLTVGAGIVVTSGTLVCSGQQAAVMEGEEIH